MQKWKDYVDPVSEHRQQLIEISELMKEFPEDADRLREAWLKVGEEMNKSLTPDEDKGELGPLAALAEDYQNATTQMELFKVEGIERTSDALAQLAITGKLNFREFAVSMLSWIVKMIIKMQILAALKAYIEGSAAPAATASTPTLGAGGPPVDSGGPGRAGQAYMIGVGAQPEMFVPQTNGQFIPIQQQGGSGGGITINGLSVVVKEQKNETSAEQASKIGRAIKEELRGLIQTEMVDARRPGNMYNPAGAT